MFESTGELVVATAFLVAFLGSGIGVAFLVGRRGSYVVKGGQGNCEPQFSDNFVRELERCLELGDYVSRDADALASIITGHAPPVDRPLGNAAQQLINTTKNLAARLHRMGLEASISRPRFDTRPFVLPPNRPEAESTEPALQPPVLAQEEVDFAQTAGKKDKTEKNERLPPGPFEDVRRFPRSSFRGSAKATIYPRNPGPGRQPIQCTVLTRDLSCGGVGIAHSEQLFPKQIIVIEAAGKLLVGEVRWCRRVDEHFYVAGCRLVKAND